MDNVADNVLVERGLILQVSKILARCCKIRPIVHTLLIFNQSLQNSAGCYKGLVHDVFGLKGCTNDRKHIIYGINLLLHEYNRHCYHGGTDRMNDPWIGGNGEDIPGCHVEVGWAGLAENRVG